MKKPTKAPSTLAALGLALALPAALIWYCDVYVNWQPGVFPFAMAAVTLGIAALTLLTLYSRGERKAGALFGYFSYDWCDASTRVESKSLADGAVATEHAGGYEYNQGRDYYFFNVREELDEPGEWYLDRSAGLLYLWPPKGDFKNIALTLNTETLIVGEGVKNLSFIGLTLQGTRGGGMDLRGDGVTVDHCVIRNLAGDALRLEGYNNTASDNEICFVGQRGIYLDGGDADTLTPGNSRAVNNLIHDWPTVAQTWMCGVELRGVGNLVAHNEIYNSAHTAIYFHGNNNTIEYNNIHDVVRHVSDSGAIY
ncbi:MAG: right-handed parallel beta-helix repeat-containing protein [Firmicutes bacterium]|nr:right-handed parallel beta-helix repeat-containing protein [Bacillota bacterium]